MASLWGFHMRLGTGQTLLGIGDDVRCSCSLATPRAAAPEGASPVLTALFHLHITQQYL